MKVKLKSKLPNSTSSAPYRALITIRQKHRLGCEIAYQRKLPSLHLISFNNSSLMENFGKKILKILVESYPRRGNMESTNS